MLAIMLLLVGNTINEQQVIQKRKTVQHDPANESYTGKRSLSFKIIQLQHALFGYDILSDDRVLVHQPYIRHARQ